MSYFRSKERIIASIVEGAELSIFLLTGKHYLLQIREVKVDPKHQVYDMLKVIAEALGMDPKDFNAGKRRVFVDLRCIGVVMIERHFPKFRLDQISEVIGIVKDSDRVSGYKKRAQDYIDTRDQVFMCKYEKAVQAVELWQSKRK